MRPMAATGAVGAAVGAVEWKARVAWEGSPVVRACPLVVPHRVGSLFLCMHRAQPQLMRYLIPTDGPKANEVKRENISARC